MTGKTPPFVVKEVSLEKIQRPSAAVDGTEMWIRTTVDFPLAHRAKTFLASNLSEIQTVFLGMLPYLLLERTKLETSL